MRCIGIFLAAMLAATGPVYADVYELPPAGYDVIGSVSTVTARYEDTLVDIARRHGLGYYDIVRANPGVNPSLTITALAERAMSFIPEKGEPGKPE